MTTTPDLLIADPTELTGRALASLKAQLEDHVASQLAIRDERLDGIVKAVSVDALAHVRIHEGETEALKLALDAASQQAANHIVSHTHAHTQEALAVTTALTALGKERDIHAEAHEKAHVGHLREHELDKLAITKAESATDVRFHSVNEFRDQLREQARQFASSDRVDLMMRENDRRYTEMAQTNTALYEQNRQRIENLEKGDVKLEGRGIGQAGTIGAIIAAVSVVGTLLGILIVIANVVTKG